MVGEMDKEDAAVARMKPVDGWFAEIEARELYRATIDAIRKIPGGVLIEVGSYKGRSTVVLASAAVDSGVKTTLFAIDPHQGVLTDGMRVSPTWDEFNANIKASGVASSIAAIRTSSSNYQTNAKVSVLFIDGLHDFESVLIDYNSYGKLVEPGGVVAFHDYSNPEFPGVKKVVDLMVARGELLLVRVPDGKDPHDTLLIARKRVKLSIIIPTCGRPRLEQALYSILENGISKRDEVIVVGDGPQPVAREIVKKFNGALPIRYFEHGPTRMVGSAQRNYAITHALGTHLAFLDDDDEYTDGAVDFIRKTVEKNPERIHVFKEQSHVARHPWGVVWKERIIQSGNVGTQGIVVPNVHGKLGSWPNNVCSDYYFLRETVNLYPDKDNGVVWVDHIVAGLY
jgi:predicted O-methyltransferase YrrM